MGKRVNACSNKNEHITINTGPQNHTTMNIRRITACLSNILDLGIYMDV